MTLLDMIWDSKASLYNELGEVIDGADNKKTKDICYNIAIYSALECMMAGNTIGSDNNVTDTNKLWDQLKETLSRYEQVSDPAMEYDGFDSTDEWKNSLEPKDREILDNLEELKQDKNTGFWIPANNEDEIYEIIKKKHPKLYDSWYFRDEYVGTNLEDKIDNICYKITIANEYRRMNLK